MDENVKKLLVISVASILIFWIFKPKGNGEGGNGFFDKKREPIRKPTISDPSVLEDEEVCKAYDCLCVYIDAYNGGESETDLQEIKNSFKSELGIDIYKDSQGRFCARNTYGDDLLNWN